MLHDGAFLFVSFEAILELRSWQLLYSVLHHYNFAVFLETVLYCWSDAIEVISENITLPAPPP